jgi:retron-type reverse transcriptase
MVYGPFGEWALHAAQFSVWPAQIFVGPVPRTGRTLKTDIAKYFDSIDHDILLNLVEKKVNNKKVLLKQK